MQQLRLKKKTNIEVSGIGGISAGKVSSVVCITLQLDDGSDGRAKSLAVKRVTKFHIE